MSVDLDRLNASITGLSATAAQVQAQHSELASAIDAERTAEALLLEQAIAAVRPALAVICRPMISLECESGIGTDRQRSRREFHAQRGLHLGGDAAAERDAPRDSDGHYRGRGLFLLADGTLALQVWSGPWTLWQGGLDEMRSELHVTTPRIAMDTYDLGDCLEALRAALEAQLTGKGPEKAKAARARAERLHAIVTLLASK